MPEAAKFRAVALLDRDGTINEEVDYLDDPARLRLVPGAARAIRILNAERVACIVTTNQSGIPRGFFTEETLASIHARLNELLAAEGARLDAIYYAPSMPESGDPRRKPARGMYDEACAAHSLAGLPVYSIGDRNLDVEFGIACGGKGIRVLTGHQMKDDIPLDLGHLHEARQQHRLFVEEDLFAATHRLLADLVLDAAPDNYALRKKFAHLHQTAERVREDQRNGLRIVLANGCFDLLHGGHMSYLADAKAAGERLVLAVNSNASISRLKGAARPILDEAARLQVLAAIRYVDYLTIFHEEAADYVLETIRPDIHAKGTDYSSETVPERLTAKRLGIQTVITGNAKENSTRDIIDVVLDRARAGVL